MARKKSHYLIYSSILTLITILCWVGFETHHQLFSSQKPIVKPGQTTPLDPRLNTQLINEIKSRPTPPAIPTISSSFTLSPTPTTTPQLTSPPSQPAGIQTTPTPP